MRLLSARIARKLGKEETRTYLSDAIAGEVISGLSPALVITSTVATARSAAAALLLCSTGSANHSTGQI